MTLIPPPRLVRLDTARLLAGITTRTSNLEEMNPLTGKIPALWGRFFAERVAQSVPGYTPQAALYGAYSGYASDVNGAYDLTAAVQTQQPPEASLGLHSLEIPAGAYMVFEEQGAMPQTVLALWAAVWQYFENAPAHPRRYAVDFEEYTGEGRIAVYIGVTVAGSGAG
jgi:predicted transcriptional regulator YdeE